MHCFPSDLTGDTVHAHDFGAPVETMAADAATRVESPELPAGWLPEGTRVHVLAIFDPESNAWESMLPEFSIAGMGKTPDDAIDNALDLLRDYLYLCARDGRSFEQSYRGMGWRWALSALGAILRLWVRERRGRRVRHVHPPLVPAH